MVKLTDKNMQTHGGFQWELGKWYDIDDGKVGVLCTDAWFHCYSNPLIAMFMNPVHANITNPRMFECDVRGEKLDDHGLKMGVKGMRLIPPELDVPEISIDQRVAFGILCAKKVYMETTWNTWADRWLNDIDRSADAAWCAGAAARAARKVAMKAARDAADAAWCAADAADATWCAGAAARAARDAADAAKSATDVARDAADAAWDAADAATDGNIDLVSIAEKAMEY